MGGAVEAARKVVPHDRTGHVEEHLGEAVGGQPGNLTEDHGVYQGGEKRLDDEPQRTEDGLLVAGDEVATHEEGDQVTVMPDLTQLQVIPLFAGRDDEVPLLLFKVL